MTNTQTTTTDYDGELDRLYTAITTRSPFRYNAASDPLYASYADRYTQNGRLAMRDSMGQAAALTGGYGSSYSAAVGQQEYDEYLRSLSEVMPQLYDRAYQRYSDEGAALLSAYELTADRADTAYAKERDAVADRRADEAARLAAEKLQYQQGQDSYNNLVKLISTAGYRPTDAELAAAGLTRAQAEALLTEYLRENGLLPSQQSIIYTSVQNSSTESDTGSTAKPGGSVSAKPSYKMY